MEQRCQLPSRVSHITHTHQKNIYIKENLIQLNELMKRERKKQWIGFSNPWADAVGLLNPMDSSPIGFGNRIRWNSQVQGCWTRWTSLRSVSASAFLQFIAVSLLNSDLHGCWTRWTSLRSVSATAFVELIAVFHLNSEPDGCRTRRTSLRSVSATKFGWIDGRFPLE